MLEMIHVDYSYKNKKETIEVFKDLSLSFNKGEICALYGCSGVGKTTCLSLLGGLEKPDRGEIRIDNKSLNDIGYETVLKAYVPYIFQDYRLLPYMTSIENMMVAARLGKKRKNQDVQVRQCMDILCDMGINSSEMNRRVDKLSGGQQQRVAIARSLIRQGDYILADEPTGNLDDKNTEAIMNILIDLAKNKGKCVVVVTHSEKVREMCDRSIRLGE